MYKYNKVNKIIDNIIGIGLITLVEIPVAINLYQGNNWMWLLLGAGVIVISSLIVTTDRRTLNAACILYCFSAILMFVGLGLFLQILVQLKMIEKNGVATLWGSSIAVITILVTVFKYLASNQLTWEFSIYPKEGINFSKKIPEIDSKIKEINIKARCNKDNSNLKLLGLCAGVNEVKIAKRKGNYISLIYNPKTDVPITDDDIKSALNDLRSYPSDSAKYSIDKTVDLTNVKTVLSKANAKKWCHPFNYHRVWIVFIDDFGEFFAMPFKVKDEPDKKDEGENNKGNENKVVEKMQNKCLPIESTDLVYDVETRVEYWKSPDGTLTPRYEGKDKSLCLYLEKE